MISKNTIVFISTGVVLALLIFYFLYEESKSKIPLDPPASTGTKKGVTELEDWDDISDTFRVFVYQDDVFEVNDGAVGGTVGSRRSARDHR